MPTGRIFFHFQTNKNSSVQKKTTDRYFESSSAFVEINWEINSRVVGYKLADEQIRRLVDEFTDTSTHLAENRRAGSWK